MGGPGSGGHNRKTRAQKQLAGTLWPDRDPKTAAAEAGVLPSPPASLRGDALQRWHELVPQIAALKVLTERDAHALAMMCRHLVVAEAALARVQKDGLVIAGARGPVKHPAHQILRDHSQAFRAYCALFGLSPVARARLGAPHEEEDDLFP